MVGVLCIGALKMGCTGVVDIMVLGGVFMVEVVEGGGTGGGVCCEASPVVCEWEGIFFVSI